MYIVSRNYRDRTSPYKWLFRKEGETPEQAVACKAIDCTNVAFIESSQHEAGFGCRMVARCEKIAPVDIEPRPNVYRAVKLKFDGIESFYEAGTASRVTNCDLLTLTGIGNMYAQLPA